MITIYHNGTKTMGISACYTLMYFLNNITNFSWVAYTDKYLNKVYEFVNDKLEVKLEVAPQMPKFFLAPDGNIYKTHSIANFKLEEVLQLNPKMQACEDYCMNVLLLLEQGKWISKLEVT